MVNQLAVKEARFMTQEKQQKTWQKVAAMIYGLVFMSVAVWGFLWSERQRTGATTTLDEILESYIDRSAIGSSTAKEYPYVYVRGKAESEELLVDDLFGLKLRALFLERRMERLERKVSRSEGSRTVSYEWVSFAEPPLTTYYTTPDPLEVSGVVLSRQLLDWRFEGERIRCDDERISNIPPFRGKALFCQSDGRLANWPEAESASEGDVRIAINYLPLGDVSALGRFSDGVLYPIEDKNQAYLYLIEPGTRTPEALVATARARVKKGGNIGRWSSIGVFLVGLFFFSGPFRHRQR
ncbi:MAG: TMEM43 family protein [Pseudomonadota bacterium]